MPCLRLAGTTILDDGVAVSGVSASMRNVDVEVQALAELDRQTRVDTLTGLVTRRGAMNRIEGQAGRAVPGRRYRRRIPEQRILERGGTKANRACTEVRVR